MLLCSDDRERAVAMRSEISSLLLLGGVYETMSITVAMRESRREKEPTVCARTAHIQHNLVPRCRSELLSSGFLDAIAISLSVARRDASLRTRMIKGSELSARLQKHISQHLVTIQHLELGEYELVTRPSSATCNVLEVKVLK